MKIIIRYLKLYKKILSFAAMKAMAYGQDFFVWSIVDMVWAVVNLGFFWILFQRIPMISGWTFAEMTIPLGMFYLLNMFLWGFMYGNMRQIPYDINQGELDVYLTKPVNSQFLVSTRFVSLSLLPSLATGLILLRYGFVNNSLNWQRTLVIPMGLLAAILISYSLWFISVTLAFWFNRLRNIGEVFGQAVDIARYPTGIFSPILRFVFTFILPFGIIGFVPAEVILGRAGSMKMLWPLTAGIVLLYLSHCFWNFSLKRYSSASS